jgi:uncharacterized membrane protein YvbJ
MTKFCKKCNAENPDINAYCGSCGERFIGDEEIINDEDMPVTDLEWLVMETMEINEHLRTIKNWVSFFGILTVISITLTFIYIATVVLAIF